MIDECYTCINQQQFLTEDFNQMKENICCVEGDIDKLCMFQQLPPQLVALTLHKMQATMMSMVVENQKLEREVIALKKRVSALDGKG